MSSFNQEQGYANLFRATGDMGCGLQALGAALKAVELDRIKEQETFIKGIGYLVDTVGGAVIELSMYGEKEAEKEAKLRFMHRI